jgi:hypothetical protein
MTRPVTRQRNPLAMTRPSPSLVAILALAITAPLHAQAKAHAHGLAELDIVIEGRAGTLAFRAPAEDLIGFERAPRTPAERWQRDLALLRLQTRMREMVRFDPMLGCTIKASALHGGADNPDHADADGHAEVHAEFALACAQPPAGRDIRFAFSTVFPAIRSVQVQLLSDDRQDGRRIERDRGTVRP